MSTGYSPPAGVADVYVELDATEGAHHDLGEDVQVTRHAEERFLERVSGREPFPRSRIRQEFREADDVVLDDDRIRDPTRVHPESGVAYVYDPRDSTVITCFIPTEQQLQGDRNEADA